MEIEFNSGRIPDTGASQPVAKKTAHAPALEGDVSLERVEALKRAVKELPEVRPEQVERARGLYNDVKYPPDEVLNRISHLLAMNMSR